MITDAITNKVTTFNKYPKYYLSKLYHKSFLSIMFKNTSTKESVKIINSLQTKESSDYDEISTKILKD